MGELPNAVLTGAALGKKVNVLDFGGNLGMGYFRAVTTMPEIIETWHVVDLSPVVEYGSKNFSDQRLKFFTHIESATDKQKPDVVICDAVLSFMSEPYAALVDMAKTGASIIVLDRTRMFLGDSEKITVQQNYSNIGNDRRPFRVVSSNKVAASLSGYRLVAQKDHNAPDPGAEDAKYMAQVYLRTIA